MSPIVHKVTCFIIRRIGKGTDLLLFNHPDVGIQIPAGTVNPGEDPEAAARREASEESGQNNLVFLRLLGQADDPPSPGHLVLARPTTVYSRPDIGSMDWAHFRIGLPVEVLRHAAGFTQVRYEETDRFIDPQYVNYSITGWVPDDALTDQRLRHFYLFDEPYPTPNRWTVAIDYTVFELFWAPVGNLPPIVQPQDGWVKWLAGVA